MTDPVYLMEQGKIHKGAERIRRAVLPAEAQEERKQKGENDEQKTEKKKTEEI